MNYLIVKRKDGPPWEFKYENNPYGPGYYYLSSFKGIRTARLYRIDFSWQFDTSLGHVPEIKIMELNDDKKHWSDATAKLGATEMRMGKGKYLFKI